MKVLHLLFAFILYLALPLSNFAQLKIVQYQLDNGLTVILNPDKTQNKVAASVAVNTGSKNDPADATGMSHYLEHLLFKGTTELGTSDYEKEKPLLDSINYYYDQLGLTKEDDQRTAIQQKINALSVKAAQYAMPNEFDKLLKSIGSTGVNATTSNDLTIYYNTFPPHQINKWLDIYAHRFINPVFRSFQSELEVVYEEKNRAMDNMQRRVLEAYAEYFYEGHPYGERNTLGTVEHLKNPSLTKMYRYFQDYYVANNMALIISGDIDIEAIKPIIEQSFGQLKRGTVPNNIIPEPRAFQGREVKKVRMTPIRAGIMGYRTVPRFHKDEIPLELISYLLQNEAGTGLIDELKNNNKLMEAYAYPEVGDEAGQQIFVFLPKIIGQSLKKAENLVLEKINRLKTGDFPDDLFNSVKNEMYKDFQRQVEELNNRGWLLANCFRKGKKWEDYAKYPQKVEQLTKQDIMEVARKYFGENYLVMQTRTGFGKKEKLKKPNYRPVKVDQSKKSVYAKRFNALESGEVQNKFIDFKKDLSIEKLGSNSTLYTVENPVNDIYELSIQFHIGTLTEPKLEVLAQLMNYAYPEGETLGSFKKELSGLGSLYSFRTGTSYFTLRLSGIERELGITLTKINDLIQQTTVDPDRMKSIINTYKTDRKVEKEEPLLIARALAQYSLYGDQAPLLKRPSLDEIKKMTAEELLAEFDKVKNHAVSIHFSGKTSSEDLKQLLNEKLSLNWDGNSELSKRIKIIDRKENSVLVVNNKKLIQSHLFFIKPSTLFELEQFPKMKLFNAYFGGGFSGILTQEIREYRSLAYTSSAAYQYTSFPDTRNFFFAYIGCQADKTNDATSVAYELMANMPEKEDRMELIRNNVMLKQQSEYPSFRALSSVVEAYQLKGFTSDPNEYAITQYPTLQFDNLIEFYRDKIQQMPTFLGIHSNLKRVNKEALKKIGTVKEIRKEEVITF